MDYEKIKQNKTKKQRKKEKIERNKETKKLKTNKKEKIENKKESKRERLDEIEGKKSMNSLGFSNIYTRIMGISIGKDNQFANPNTVEEHRIPSPINNNTNNNSTRTKLHPEVSRLSNDGTPVLNFVIEDEDELETNDRFFGKNVPTRRSQEPSGKKTRNIFYFFSL